VQLVMNIMSVIDSDLMTLPQ